MFEEITRDDKGRFTILPPSPEYLVFPTRHRFVADEMRRHEWQNDIMCLCGPVLENHYLDHMAKVAIDAADKWDELLMREDSEAA
jgi:hypothetical protein